MQTQTLIGGIVQAALRVFVYGTLKPGEANYSAYCEPWITSAQEAIVLGTLYDLPLGYPALAVGQSIVYGYLLTFSAPSVLLRLDELESYDPGQPDEVNEYSRSLIAVLGLDHQPIGQAWVYRMQAERIYALGGVLIPEGRWSGQMQQG
jgi:gamma-glutamylcyclotransferase (GGCT)/AIG2-like uncharacterized protein YtfP